ncbi:MAG: hypothetical protein WCI20_10005 [bacterium]
MRLFDQILDSRHVFLSGIMSRMILFLFLLSLPLTGLSAPPLFARFTTDRNSITADEAFQLTLSIYVAGGNLDKQVSISGMPAPTNLLVRSFEELPAETTILEGLAYEVRSFRTWARASHAGPLTLAPQLNATLIQTSRSFFLMQESRRPVRIPTESFSLTIRPLPVTGRPLRFSGLVGKYSFSATAAPLDIALGDLITLTLTVEGDWIPDDFVMSGIEGTPCLKEYAPIIAKEECFPVKHVTRQTVVPQDPSCTAIPPLSFCYFDTGSGTYIVKTVGPFPITYHAERVLTRQPYSSSRIAVETNKTSSLSGKGKIRPSPESAWHSRWRRLSGNREVTLRGTGDVSIRLAPAESSSELFTLKPGIVVNVESKREGWLRISCQKGIGWLRNVDIQE